uniref:Ig-like domain-containing protein n=1 Tax=Varanus komodoensis TaxID=61221 RepID=A0A8D2LEZ6_VARKO
INVFCFTLAVHASVQLEESGGGILQPGQTLRLTCTVTGDSVKNVYWDWVRQAPGKSLEWVGEIDWSSNRWRTYYAPSLQSQATLTADASKNQYYIELRSLAAADTATYYCARSTVRQSKGEAVQKPSGSWLPAHQIFLATAHSLLPLLWG